MITKIRSISLAVLLIGIISSPLSVMAEVSTDSSSTEFSTTSLPDKSTTGQSTVESTSESTTEKTNTTSSDISSTTSESSTQNTTGTSDDDVHSTESPSYNPDFFSNRSTGILTSSDDVKIPFPVHYDLHNYDNYGQGLNNLFPQFLQAYPFGADSTSQLLQNGAWNAIGGINTSKTITLEQNFEMSGTIYVEPWGLGYTDSGDGFSIGFHGDVKNAHGGAGGNLGISGIKNGYFFLMDLYKNTGELDPPFIGRSTTDSDGKVTSHGMNKMYQTDSRGARKEGPRAVFGDYYYPRYGYFTPFEYHFKYDQKTRELTFSLKNYKGEEQTTSETNSFILPDNIKELNFYAAGVSGGKRSNYKLNITHTAFSEYKTNTPKIEKFDIKNNKYNFQLINPNADRNPIEPKNYSKRTKATYIIDNKEPIETILGDHSNLSIDKLESGNHRIQIKLQSLYSDDENKYAAYSDYENYDFVDGKLTLVSAPDNINFGEVKRKPDNVNLKGVSMGDLIVSDTRAIDRKTDWQISLKETNKLISDQVKLSYINRDNKNLIINDQNQPIEHNLPDKPEEEKISEDWKKPERGLFLDIPPEAQKIGEYSGSLTWTLQDTPQAN